MAPNRACGKRDASRVRVRQDCFLEKLNSKEFVPEPTLSAGGNADVLMSLWNTESLHAVTTAHVLATAAKCHAGRDVNR